MRNNNRRLVILVASVAVAAVGVGAAFAYRQGPQTATADAAPLTGSPSPTLKPSPTPSKTPTTTPKPTPTPKPSSAPPTSIGPAKVTVDINKLAKGREPAIPYLIGRELRGGSGSAIKIPGTGGFIAVGRLETQALAVVTTGEDGTELLKVDDTGDVRRTPGVTSLATTADQSAAAYAASRLSSLGGPREKGGILYAETVGEGGAVRSLKLPDAWSVQVLEYVDGKVYYRADTDDTGAWKLYSWTPGSSKPTLIKTVASPSAMSSDGRVASSVNLINDRGSCSTMADVASGKQFSRTCDYWITGFTPDTVTAVGGPAYGDGYCDTVQAAVDTRSGKLIREWNGCFMQIVAEDDQHVLIVAIGKGQGEETGVERAIIRCSLATPTCELATPIAVDKSTEIGT